ncbi:MAG: hypothetical protein A3F68_09200 [Acidobacteria bacterium RIFCSPLOWO2_12_FULL_54_10]|nr:MAG: hypothetical protein A3F68_09200 [Acidobacteria bacterium RIFCSPLOWO2_12_FULL_54_10]
MPLCLSLLGIVINLPAAIGQNVIYSPDSIEWKDAPPSLPKGAKVAVLRGDPAQPGLFTMRLRFPANYIVSPHWHTADEHVTVISGALQIAMGERFDRTKTNTITSGSLMVMPATMRHFAFFAEETVLQLHGMGPWVVNYVNPQDDPRLK